MRRQKDGFDRDDQVSQGTVASQHRATGPMTCDFSLLFLGRPPVVVMFITSLQIMEASSRENNFFFSLSAIKFSPGLWAMV